MKMLDKPQNLHIKKTNQKQGDNLESSQRKKKHKNFKGIKKKKKLKAAFFTEVILNKRN